MDGKKADDGNGTISGLFLCSECDEMFENVEAKILHYSSEHLKYKPYNGTPAKLLSPERIQPVCTMTPPPKEVNNEEEQSSDQRQITCELEREAEFTAVASQVGDLHTLVSHTEEVTMVAIDPPVGENPSSCPYCPLMFSMCSTMKKHLESVHPMPMTKSSIQSSHFGRSQILCKMECVDEIDDNYCEVEQQSEDPTASIPTPTAFESTNEKESSASSEMNPRSVGKPFNCFRCKAHFSTPQSFKRHLLKFHKVTEASATSLIASFYRTSNNDHLVEEEDSDVASYVTHSFAFNTILASNVNPVPSLNTMYADSEEPTAITEDSVGHKTAHDASPKDHDMEPGHKESRSSRRSKPKGSAKKQQPSGEKPYKCPYCPLAYSHERSTLGHIKRKHSSMLRARAAGMERAIRIFPDHHAPRSSGQSKPKGSAKKQQPSGAKPYKCPHCPLAYYYPWGRRDHIKLKHPAMLRAAGMEPAVRSTPAHQEPRSSGPSKPTGSAIKQQPSGEKPFKCPHCPLAYYHDRARLFHIKLKHPMMLSKSSRKRTQKTSTKLSGREKVPIPASMDTRSHKAKKEAISRPFRSTPSESGDSSIPKNHPSSEGIGQTKSQILLRKENNVLEDPTNQSKQNGNQSEDHNQYIWFKELDGKIIYICEYCSKEFVGKYHLASHRLAHTGEKPYQCSLCSQAFARADKLKGHTQRVHGVKFQPSGTRKGIKAKRR